MAHSQSLQTLNRAVVRHLFKETKELKLTRKVSTIPVAPSFASDARAMRRFEDSTENGHFTARSTQVSIGLKRVPSLFTLQRAR